MLIEFKEAIASQLAKINESLDKEKLIPMLEAPKNPENGDVAIAIPRLKLKGNPVQIGKELAEKFEVNDMITKVVAMGPFLNFSINKETLKKLLLQQIFDLGPKFGTTDSSKVKKKVIVEFSSPNIAKPFHAGHLRSTIIGNFIAKAHQANGYDTVTMNYLGDWGKQYGLLALGFNRYGSEEALLKDPIQHLFEIYVKINVDAETDETIHDQARAYFKKMEEGDAEVLKLWSHFRDLSIEKYKETYARLNIHFDIYSGESQVNEPMQRAYQLLEAKGLLVDSNGAKLVDLEAYKLGKVVVQKSDGTALYITRDIGAAMQRYEQFQFDAMYYVVASQQDLHLKQLFKILELLEFDWASKCHHIAFGMVTGMSTRKGNVVFLDDILQEAQETMHAVMRQNPNKYAQIPDPEAVADLVGISAVVVQDLSAKRIKNYAFHMETMVSFEGDTGPYLQYAHSRLTSILRKAHFQPQDPRQVDLTPLQEEVALELIGVLATYPDLVQSLMVGFEPCAVVHYALKLAHAVSSCVDQLWVLNQPEGLALPRLVLYSAAQVTLANCLQMIGLTPLERM